MTSTSYYSRYSEELENRIDSNYNDPKYDTISTMLGKARFPIVFLGQPEVLKSIISGKTPKGLHYVKEGIPFLGGSSIFNGLVDVENASKIPHEIHETKLASSQIKKGNVLITMAGTIGRCAVYALEQECNANQAVAILNINSNNVNPYFLTYFLNSEIGNLFFGKLQHISSQPNINLEEIKQIQVVLPKTTEEQRNIVSKIRDIENEAKKLEAESEDVSNKASSEIMNELNIPVSEADTANYFFKSAEEKTITFPVMPNEFSDRLHYLFFHPKLTLLEKLKEKYAVERFETVCAEPIRRGKPSDYDENGEVKIVKTVDLKNSYIDYDNCLRVSHIFLEDSPNEAVKKNDVLVASTGYVSLGKVDIHERDELIVVDRHVSVLRLKKKYDPCFVAYFLRSHLGQIQFEKWFSGASGQIDIWPSDLNEFLIPESSERGISLTRQIEIAAKITQKLDKAHQLRENAKIKWKEAKQLFEQTIYNP